MLVGVSEIASACAVGSEGTASSEGIALFEGEVVTVLVDSITRRRFVRLAAWPAEAQRQRAAGDGSNGTGGPTGWTVRGRRRW